ncbi:hypothetical protein SSS_02255 [Sarcoptes scabiei]|nr:hypothetical protein SSS_02255 [Sarcoptes scabiei]
MSSLRKWIASKVFASVLSNDSNQMNSESSNNGSFLFESFGNRSLSVPSILSSSNSLARQDDVAASTTALTSSSTTTLLNSQENQSYFSLIYHHYKSRKRHDNSRSQNRNKIKNDRELITYMFQFYNANEELNSISSELDNFDGRKDADRCSALVNSLKIAQDKVIGIIFKIMDEIDCQRSPRDYRLKFSDELLSGEGIESLNSQIWFAAECLAAGSIITNNHDKSNYLRPIASNLTTTLDQIRYELRSCCNYLPKNMKIPDELKKKLENFDNLFSSFEYDYVKTMSQIKTSDDIENLQELTFLFSDTLKYALEKDLISKDDVEGCQPNVMIALPRLSIVRGLLQGYGSVVCRINRDDIISILRPYHNLLLEFHEFLSNLNEEEILYLEKLLSNNHDNIDTTENDNHYFPLLDIDKNNQYSLLMMFNKFIRHTKRIKELEQQNQCQNDEDIGHRCTLESDHQQQQNRRQPKHNGKISFSNKSRMNRCISASVNFLMINNSNQRSECFNDCDDPGQTKLADHYDATIITIVLIVPIRCRI